MSRRVLALVLLAGLGCGGRGATPEAYAWIPVGEQWFGVYQQGRKCGYMRLESRLEGSRLEWLEEASYRLSSGGVTTNMWMCQEKTYDLATGMPLHMLMKSRGFGNTVSFSARPVEGGVDLTVRAAGSEATHRVPTRHLHIDNVLKVLRKLMGSDLEPGTVIYSTNFEVAFAKDLVVRHTVLSNWTETIRGVPEELVAIEEYLVEERVPIVSVYNSRGDTIRGELAEFVVYRSEPRQLAMDVRYSLDDYDLRVRPRGRIPVPAGRLTELTLEISSRNAPPSLDDFPGGTTEVRGSSLLVKIRRVEPPATCAPADPEAYREELSPDPFIHSDHPDVVALARRVTDGAPDPVAAVRRLLAWVHENVRFERAYYFSNAPDVLADRAGDCLEHAVLLTALCRAAGIPARTVGGLVHMGSFFAFHEWTEVNLGGAWVPIDSTWNEFPANPSHVRVAEGGIPAQARIALFLSSLEIRIVDAR